ncbi:MAG TPA: pyridoxine 5'-phosphate synthase [candidate division Zixibacteria bacterium]|nr:pyridoxine 5'-phosphate synthase [candidate division Zixibacteria bacterium]
MSSLIVNLDLFAVLREMRRLNEPDPAQAAVLAELYGAAGVAVQMRRDRRFIRERDLYILKGIVKTKLVVEIPPVEDLIEKVLEIKPHLVIFVADHADSDIPSTTINFNSTPVDFGAIASRLVGLGVEAGFFVEPDPDEIKGASRAGASAVLINCSGFTEARTFDEAQHELDRIDHAANIAAKANLHVLGGRGVTYKNILPLVELGNISEFIVGHAIGARSILLGYERALEEMIRLLKPAPANE